MPSNQSVRRRRRITGLFDMHVEGPLLPEFEEGARIAFPIAVTPAPAAFRPIHRPGLGGREDEVEHRRPSEILP